FGKGDPVRIVDEGGAEVARGLVNYSAEDVRKIAGRKSGEIGEALGTAAVYEEVVHRDNLVVGEP
ncbi:MAG: PUA domain-containing protein, partial [Planctomycetota bacterium]|nr:PUA domain-containing protein [Planctomycetota bacterium]